ncbi:MAG: hypothetical protein ACPL5I_05315 [Thermodesulfobacteriota bacterium]
MPEAYKVKRGKGGNKINISWNYTLLIDLEEIDPAYQDDEITLESDDKSYKQTLILGKDGEAIDNRWLKLTFTKIIPGKTYTCIHDLKRTSEQKTGKIVLFRSASLEVKHLNKIQQVEESLSENEKEEFASGLWKKEKPQEMPKWETRFGKKETQKDEEKWGFPVDGDDEDLWLNPEKGDEGWKPKEEKQGIEEEEKIYQNL